MSSLSFSDAESQAKRKQTRREKFLAEMEALLPWAEMEKTIRRYYSMRRFAGITIDTVPDETTILHFRHLLEKHKLLQKIFDRINTTLAKQGLTFKEGTIMDATIIAIPTSTNNQDNARDPEMHQVKKGNEWHFGMKLHIGVVSTFGLIHTLKTTSANVHDITVADQLLHGQEEHVIGDAGYVGIEKREEHKDRSVDWMIAARPGTQKTAWKTGWKRLRHRSEQKWNTAFSISNECLITAKLVIVVWRRIQTDCICCVPLPT